MNTPPHTMMDYPLTLNALLERAGRYFADTEVISRLPDRSLHRSNWGEIHHRARKLAACLLAAGLNKGDRVATLMWNHYAHLECYFGVPAAGGVLHALNLRLHCDDIAWIANHAQDRFLIVDDVLLPVLEKFIARVNFERVWVVRHPGATVQHAYGDYESWLQQPNGDMQLPEISENDSASMCYTSGTTGNPKGVLYSHRSQVLHSMSQAMADSCAFSQHDVVLLASPMFHANGWGFSYSAAMVGAKYILPGPHLDAESLLDLIEHEGVTMTCAVPTVWLGVLAAMEQRGLHWKPRQPVRILCGGTAPPESLIRNLDRHNFQLIHSWGMTETSPQATASRLQPKALHWPEEQQYAARAKQGWPVPGIEVRTCNEQGPAPWDGKTMGELEVRGAWVAGGYYNAPESQDRWTKDGWFRTGDVATIDPDGCIKLVDRSKDMVKSGGEWISSVDLENTLMSHPAVREAGVIAVHHPKWQERPLAVVALKDGAHTTADELRALLAAKFAKWQLPDDFVFVQELPHTSTGKLLKTELRKQYAGWRWKE
ncbi:MAG TPA: long-chain fatty acid--CoA ligase [Candidatus Angelobacter sp.]|nr:long-chain fatty acid--CoA ligase [Candidatus Angelobacter sp.]